MTAGAQADRTPGCQSVELQRKKILTGVSKQMFTESCLRGQREISTLKEWGPKESRNKPRLKPVGRDHREARERLVMPMEVENSGHPVYSLILPIYDEELVLPELFIRFQRLLERLDAPAEVILVDDGSRDGSFALMAAMHRQDPRFKILHLSRNFGHQIAITAGMDFAQGEAIVVMDADLQDPPEVVPAMAERWREGYQVVYAVRTERQGERWFKRKTAAWFCALLDRVANIRIPKNVGDFRLVDRQALTAFNAMRETHRYVRGMLSWIGFKQTEVTFVRAERFAGRPKYSFRKSLELAINALLSFSRLPRRLALVMGGGLLLLSVLFGGYLLGRQIFGHAIGALAPLAELMIFLSGVQLVMLGMMGEYVGRIYEEMQNRPLYIVQHKLGFSPEAGAQAARVVVTDTRARDTHAL